MHSLITIARAQILVDAGWSRAAISRKLGVSRYSVRAWDQGAIPGFREREKRLVSTTCPACAAHYEGIPTGPYAYLLGQYLGDGSLALCKRNVYRLRVSCATAWPGIMRECMVAIRAVRPENKVGVVYHPTAKVAEVYAHSKHWICFFPQHGKGPKNARRIVLEDWQRTIISSEPGAFIRGLIHSDGCRCINVVNDTPYPRYLFSNTSRDIMNLAGETLDRLGIEWRYNRWNSLSVARRASVARLDEIVGPKY